MWNDPSSLIQNVKLECESDEPGQEMYEQLGYNGHWLKLGDGLMVKGEGALPDILRIDKLWRTPE